MVRQEAAGSRSNSLVVSLGMFVLWVLLIVGGQKVFYPNASSLDDLVKSQLNIIFVIAIVLLLGVTFFFNWQRQVGLKPVAPPRSWLLLWPQALFIPASQAAALREVGMAGPLLFLLLLIPVVPVVLMLYGLWLLRGIGKQSKDEVLA